MGHGISTVERATSVNPINNADCAVPVIVGVAPINMGNVANVNNAVLCNSFKEAVAEFGYIKNHNNTGFTISEAIDVLYNLYNVSSCIFINVLDPENHKKSVSEELQSFIDDELVIEHTGILKDSVQVMADIVVTATSTAGATASSTIKKIYEEGKDYDLSYNDLNGYMKIKLISGGEVEKGSEVKVSYDYLDASMVSVDDIVGGVDSNTNKRKGIEVIEELYGSTKKVGTIFLAPKFSSDNKVAIMLANKANKYGGLFSGIAICDIEDDTIKKYSDAVNVKLSKNLIDKNLIACWPKVQFAGTDYYMSIHLAGIMCQIDSDSGIPYQSPSNKVMKIDNIVNNRSTITLSINESNFLNDNGICTIRHLDGFYSWGNRTTVYPQVTDVKDNFIHNRRMFSFYNNTILLNNITKVDSAVNRRFIENMMDNIQYWLNGLVAGGYILGGRIEFVDSENLTTDLMNGKIVFNIYSTPAGVAEDIIYTMEYDPAYFSTLFS